MLKTRRIQYIKVSFRKKECSLPVLGIVDRNSFMDRSILKFLSGHVYTWKTLFNISDANKLDILILHIHLHMKDAITECNLTASNKFYNGHGYVGTKMPKNPLPVMDMPVRV
jgi:hypothetical protein